MPTRQLDPAGTFPATSLGRRLIVAGYDLFLLIAAWMVVTFAYLGIHILFTGEQVAQQQAEAGGFIGDYLLTLIIFGVSLLFYLSFWTLKGQTLGMQVWRIRVQQPDGMAITRRQAVIRFLVAQVAWLSLGLGFAWSIWDPKSRTWHDMASGTELVTLPKGTFKK